VCGVAVDTATALTSVYLKCECALGQNISRVVQFIFLIIHLSESKALKDENVKYAI